MLHRWSPRLSITAGVTFATATQASAWIRTNASSRCFGGQLLRVPDAVQVEPVGQDHRGGDHRARRGPPAPPRRRRPPARSPAPAGRARTGPWRRSRSTDPSCARRRPDLHERLPDHLVDRHVAEPLRRLEPGVPGLEPVVTQHEQHAIGNRLGPVGGAYRSGASGRARRSAAPSTYSWPARISQVWPGSAATRLMKSSSCGLRHPHPFAEPVHEPADEPAFGTRLRVRVGEDQDVAAMDVRDVEAHAAHEDPVAVLQQSAPSTATG